VDHEEEERECPACGDYDCNEDCEQCRECGNTIYSGGSTCGECLEREEELERERELAEARESHFIQRLTKVLESTDLAVVTDQCCGSCSASAGGNTCDKTGQAGYAYFHEQDIEGYAHSDEICVGYGAHNGKDPEGEAVGHRIFNALEAAGLTAEWDKSVRTRITVKS
jgi:uncharacterized protein DUF6891